MPEEGGGGEIQVCMTNNDEGCIRKTIMTRGEGGGVKVPQNSMTSVMDDPSDHWHCLR